MTTTEAKTNDRLSYLKKATDVNFSCVSSTMVTLGKESLPEFTLQVYKMTNALTNEESILLEFHKFWLWNKFDEDGNMTQEKEIVDSPGTYIIEDIDVIGLFLAKLTPESKGASIGSKLEFRRKDKDGNLEPDLHSFCGKGYLTKC